MNNQKQPRQAQRTLGIIGGMSWESTESYYRIINEGIKAELGGLHSADLLKSCVSVSSKTAHANIIAK